MDELTLKELILVMKERCKGDARIHDAFICMTALIDRFCTHLEEKLEELEDR